MKDTPDCDRYEVMRKIGAVSCLFREEMRRACSESGLPLGYRAFLYHLGGSDGLTQKELAQKTGLRPATVSVTVDRMERDGYVTRRKDEDDRRVYRVCLTEKGRLTDRDNRAKVETLEKQFSGMITGEEQRELSLLLSKIIEGYAEKKAAEERKEDAHG